MTNSINDQVAKKFPQLRGVRPKISSYGESGKLMIYSTNEVTASGKPITFTVRVVVDGQGKIKKITTSR